MRTNVSDLDYQRLHEFRYQLRRFMHFSEEAVRAANLEPQQHQLLLAVKARGGADGLLIGEVGERLSIRHHSAVELVNRVEARGLVARHHFAGDRRQVFVQLTAEGDAVLAQLAAVHLDELRSAAPRLLDALGTLVEPEVSSAVGERR